MKLKHKNLLVFSATVPLTVDLNSFWGFLLWGLRLNSQRVSGPPSYSTWNRRAAKESVAVLAGLEPRVLASGHGVPMTLDSPNVALLSQISGLKIAETGIRS